MMVEDMGHTIDVVENGALAVAACARTAYDIVLMDGRMPEIDGATATRLIRAGGTFDAPVLDPRIMIVALTANASDEDRDRYLACGMDAFLAKPIDEAALHRQLGLAIERQLARGIALAPMDAPAPVTEPAPSTAALDALFGIAPGEAPPAAPPAPLPARRAGQLQARLCAAFAADLPRRRQELRAAIDGNDDEACARVLHGLRGSAGHLGAGELAVLCARLEKAVDGGRRDELLAGLARLDALLDAFDTSLT